MRLRPARLLFGLTLAASAAVAPLATGSASAAGTGAVHPGVMTYTDGAQCTANFIFTDGSATYIGQAAHCSGTGASTDTNGCTAQSLPLGTPVEVGGASKPGAMVYNSWLNMQANGEKDPDTCAYNDIALVKLDPADAANVDPSVPFFGGPTGLATTSPAAGDTVYSYGNSSLRQGLSPLSPKYGKVVQDDGGGWTHTVYTVTPGIPGDSGSGFLNSNGEALGVLSTVAIAPLAASNNVSDLNKMLNYMHAHGGPNASLVQGTTAFAPIV
ncbi:MAG TPA: trypsin-like serine protease [Frankiaceae bacterium]|nr:trypsin-like serine protease [Frankiaceae bacterium]